MLIPVYVLGFIFGGLVLFAIAYRVRNRRVKIALRTIGVIAGPVFFLVVAIFSGWERERTYEVEWLTGSSAAEYLGDRNPDVTNPITKKTEELVVLRRSVGDHHDCYQTFASSELAHYLEGQKAPNVKVRYMVTYDFFISRGYNIAGIGDFGREPATKREISIGWLGGGEKLRSNTTEHCFPW